MKIVRPSSYWNYPAAGTDRSAGLTVRIEKKKQKAIYRKEKNLTPDWYDLYSGETKYLTIISAQGWAGIIRAPVFSEVDRRLYYALDGILLLP